MNSSVNLIENATSFSIKFVFAGLTTLILCPFSFLVKIGVDKVVIDEPPLNKYPSLYPLLTSSFFTKSVAKPLPIPPTEINGLYPLLKSHLLCLTQFV